MLKSMAGEKIKLLMPLLSENWGLSLCLLMADCQLALCSFRSAKCHNAFWHGKRKNTWWRARRQLGSWLRSWIMEWKTRAKGREKHGENIAERGVRSRVCSLGCSREQQQRDGLLQGAVQGHEPQTLSGFAFCGRLISVVMDLYFHCLISLYLALKPKSKQCTSCQTFSESLSVAPGRNSWVLPELQRPLSPAVGTYLTSRKGCENGWVFFIQMVYNIFVTFSYCLILLWCALVSITWPFVQVSWKLLELSSNSELITVTHKAAFPLPFSSV